MARYFLPGTIGAGDLTVLTSGISDLVLGGAGNRLRLFSTTGAQGGILAIVPGTFTTGEGIVSRSFPSVSGRAGTGQLEIVTLGNVLMLAAFGTDAGAIFYRLDSGRPLDAASRQVFGGETLSAMVVLPGPASSDLVFTTSLQSQAVTIWQRAANGMLTRLEVLSAGEGATGRDMTDLALVIRNDSRFVLAVSAQDVRVAVYSVTTGGQVVLVDTLDPTDGLAVSRPTLLTTIADSGRDLVLIGSPGTGSVTVARLDSNGRLTVLDQVNDDLNTRFQSIGVLEAIRVGDRIYVVAGGADDGLTLMTILPDGRLVHLETIVDDTGLTLADPTGLALNLLSDGVIEVFVTSEQETGITRLHIETGDPAPIRHARDAGGTLQGDDRPDMLIGGAGRDVLHGRNGDDIIVDGAGSDRMYGGSGADTFVFLPDGHLDEVMDFEIGADQLDLSALGPIYGPDSLTLVARDYGLEIRYNAEIIRLYAANGQSIAPVRLIAGDIAGLWHVVPIPSVGPDKTIRGSDAGDMLLGKDGDDAIIGGSGGDTLYGGAGGDTLLGETTDNEFDGAAASIHRLYLATLGRSPDLDGHLSWTTALVQGIHDLTTIATGFTGSAEFLRSYGTLDNRGFVTLLYRNVLWRDPDAAGLANWMQALVDGRMDRAAVVTGFSESDEFIAASAAQTLATSRAGHQALWVDEVYRLYLATLGRNPDAGGLAGWAMALAEGRSLSSIAAGFTESLEFRSIYGTPDDAAFVTLLYWNVLGRAPEPAGLAGWLQALALDRIDRLGVVLGFSESREFITSTYADLIRFMRGLPTDDCLHGGSGDDLLFGGLGPDMYVFDRAHPGTDRVVGLEAWDRISFSGFGYDTVAEALAQFRQNGDDLVFRDQDVTVLFVGSGRVLPDEWMLLL